jgi:hypothetical protein
VESTIDDNSVELILPTGLDEGEHVVEFSATDANGSVGTDSIVVVAEPNTAPEVSIISPGAGSVSSYQPLTMVATLTDGHTRSEDLVWIWTSSVDGELSGDAELSGSTLSLYLADGLSEGVHELELQGIDEQGAVGVDRVTVEAESNAAPEVVFVLPESGSHYEDHSTVVVEVEITDDNDRGEDLELTWGGLVDYEWCTGELPSTGSSGGVVTTTLRIECNHYYGESDFFISVSAMDSAGATGQGSVVVSTTCPP